MHYEEWFQHNKEYASNLDRTKPLVLGLAGGSACGKTSVARILLSGIPNYSLIAMDQYYKDLTEEQYTNISEYNFDHPDAFDFELLLSHINNLLNGQEIHTPIYDFTSSKREYKTTLIKPSNLIIIEGIFVLYEKRVRNMLDIKVFIDTDSDIRLCRRSKDILYK